MFVHSCVCLTFHPPLICQSKLLTDSEVSELPIVGGEAWWAARLVVTSVLAFSVRCQTVKRSAVETDWGQLLMSCRMKDTVLFTGHQNSCPDSKVCTSCHNPSLCALVSFFFFHFFFFFKSVSYSECRTFKLLKPNRASEVTRSRHSSAWPIPFYGHFQTSRSGIAADAHEESSPRGTEGVCLCNGRVGRSHTVGKWKWKQKNKEGEQQKEKRNKLFDAIDWNLAFHFKNWFYDFEVKKINYFYFYIINF